MCFAVYTMLSESYPHMVIVGYVGVSQTNRKLDGMPAINAKRVYRTMRQNALLLERKPAVPPSKRAHTGRVAVKESNQRWCSDGFEFRCDNGEKLRVTFALDCCDREHCTGRSQRVASTVKQYRTSCWEQWDAALAASFRRLQWSG